MPVPTARNPVKGVGEVILNQGQSHLQVNLNPNLVQNLKPLQYQDQIMLLSSNLLQEKIQDQKPIRPIQALAVLERCQLRYLPHQNQGRGHNTVLKQWQLLNLPHQNQES